MRVEGLDIGNMFIDVEGGVRHCGGCGGEARLAMRLCEAPLGSDVQP